MAFSIEQYLAQSNMYSSYNAGMHSVNRQNEIALGANDTSKGSFGDILCDKYEAESNSKIDAHIYDNKGVIDENELMAERLSGTEEVSGDKPLWYWHDGQFGYYAEVYKNEGTESEYTVKLKYDDGREEERIVDADAVNSSDCNIVDLSVKMYHLEAEGKIENSAPQILIAHLYMRYRTPDANEMTCIGFKGWFEQQLELEMKNGGSEKNINGLLELLKYL